MRHLKWLAAPALVSMLLLSLPGCGGGGAGNSVGSVGRVSGNVFLPGTVVGGRAAASPITVTLEGTNLGTTATPDGRFLIDRAPVGLHTLVAQSANSAISLVVQVQRGVETRVGDLVLQDAGQISGLVTSSATGAPISNARVTVTAVVSAATDTMPPLPVRFARTDRSGSYTISGLAPGSYQVTAEKAGFIASSLSLDVVAGTTTAGDFQLAVDATGPSGSVAGVVTTVTDAGTSTPVAGVLVRLSPPDVVAPASSASGTSAKVASKPTGRCETDFYAYTDDTGAYKIDGVPAGTYQATATRPGFHDASASVRIAAGQTATANFVLQANVPQVGTIAGDVHDSVTGLPIAGALVGLRLAVPPGATNGGGASANLRAGRCDPSPIYVGPGLIDVTATTDASGHFSLRAPAGTVEIFVQANGYSLHVENIDVTTGATTTVSVALVAQSGETVTLSGTVVTRGADGTPKPVAGADVVAGRLDDPTMSVTGPMPRPDLGYHTKTAADGTFSVKVVAGQYWVSAWSGDLGAAPTTVSALKDASVTIEIGEVWPMRATNGH